MFDIKQQTEKILKGCIVKADCGINLYTPDGMGNYPALWTRDFAYMVEYANDLLPSEDIKNGIQYILNGADKNGWIPDRVDPDGTTLYTAGGPTFPASPNLDNGCFLVICADTYLNTLEEDKAIALFGLWKDGLCRGIDCLPKDENGFIVNYAQPPHSPYGFTDTVCKMGKLCYETLLLWRAQKALSYWLKKCRYSSKKYEDGNILIEKNFMNVFSQKNGMLEAADGICGQTDIWGSCYAVSIGFPMSLSERKGIADWLIKNYDSIVQSGQIRHLPEGEYWEKTFIEVEEGTYQNGAFWATPTGWFIEAIMDYDRELASKTLNELFDCFEKYGIFECVNGEYRKLISYVVSATNIYGFCKKYHF